MTQQQPRLRNRIRAAATAQGPIAAVLLLAAMLRLDGIDFGLPALNDPDEPLFIMLAVDMLQRGSFDPQWFGHPGTVTLYCLAIIIAAVAGMGWLAGQWADQAGFVAAVYADPGIVVLPARIFIAANGVACVWLTYLLGKRLWGKEAGLIAALVLAVNAVHIGWSQVIRTDIQASLFMLLCTLQALAILREGKLRHYLLAGVFAGLACATKWPAAIVGLSPLAAAIWRIHTEQEDRRLLLAVPLAALAALLIVSPYLLISYDVVLFNLTQEGREAHPGATGDGLLGNALWYAAGPLATSFGIPGLLLAGLGAIGAIRHRDWRIAVLPGFAAFLLVISAQHVLWERWLIPVLSFLALGFAWSVGWIGRALSRGNARIAWPRSFRFRSRHQSPPPEGGGLGGGVPDCWPGTPTPGPSLPGRGDSMPVGKTLAQGAAVLALLVPALIANHARSAERHNDTRQLASEWVRRHVPPGSTILVEHAALDLLDGHWKVTFPLGSAGCIDAKTTLSAKISAPEVEKRRRGRPVVDLGHVDLKAIPACRQDFAVLTNLDRYKAERERFPEAIRRYELLLSDGRIQATFRPRPGETGGPVVHIIQF